MLMTIPYLALAHLNKEETEQTATPVFAEARPSITQLPPFQFVLADFHSLIGH